MSDDLDVRIRELVARAVADAPPAPELDPAVSFTEPEPDHRRWWIGGGAAVLAAAAVAATFVLVAPGEDSVTTPGTLPPTQPTTPSTTVPQASTTTSGPPTVIATGGVLTAGPDGVRQHLTNETRILTNEAMAIALEAGDGRILVQRGDGAAPLVLGPVGALTELFDTADWDGDVTLHDVEMVGPGRRLLLFSLRTGDQATEVETLYVVDLDTMERTEVGPIAGDEAGTHRLHLAATGLIVGEAFAEASHSILIAAVPGSAAAASPLPTAGDLGLDESYRDCTDCPHAFTVTPDGRAIMWINSAGGMVVARTLTQPIADVEPLVDVPDGRAIDLDVNDVSAVLSFSGDPTPAPAVLPLDGGGPLVLEGVAATQPPRNEATVPLLPPNDVPPATAATTTTTVVPSPAGVMLATAGPDGVGVIENGVEMRRLDQAAEIALLTPGGAVIFQPQRTAPDGTPGDPLIWRPDGSVETLLGPLAANQSYRLHDLAVVNGVPTLLYGIAARGSEPDGYSEAVHALTMTPGNWTTVELAEVNTWEGGFTRLSLSTTGVVVGTAYESVSNRYFSTALPAATAVAPDAAALGVSAESGDEPNRPDDFTISHDGESIVWFEGPVMVVFDTVAGERVGSWTVPSITANGVGTSTVVRSLDVRTSSDGGVEAAISFGFPADQTSPHPVVAATAPPGDVVETPVAGQLATFGP
jgi:hypothetical protein